MRLIRHALAAMLAVGVLLAGSSCATPRGQAAIMQELNDAATEINGLKSDIANLQTQLDSMRTILASTTPASRASRTSTTFQSCADRHIVPLSSTPIEIHAYHDRILHDVKLRTSSRQVGG